MAARKYLTCAISFSAISVAIAIESLSNGPVRAWPPELVAVRPALLLPAGASNASYVLLKTQVQVGTIVLGMNLPTRVLLIVAMPSPYATQL